MSSIIMENTETGLWQHLVHEAEQANHIVLSGELESYLVFLLMRFNKKPELAASVLAEEFLYSQQLIGQNQQAMLRDVGDKCLLYAGLYPHRAQRRRVNISYYVNLGRTAYANLAELQRNSFKHLFIMLQNQFVSLMDLLHCIRDFSQLSSPLLVLEAYELWQECGSQHGLKILKQHAGYFHSYLAGNLKQKH